MSEEVRPSDLVGYHSDDFLIEMYRDLYEQIERIQCYGTEERRWMSAIATELINRGWTIREEVELVFNKEEVLEDENGEDDKYFVITRVHRDDLKSVFGEKYKESIDNISNANMNWIARKMADDYIGQLFWSQIRILAKDIVDDALVGYKVDMEQVDEE